MTTIKTLANGLTVIVSENRFAPVVSLNVWIQAGSADETDAEAGIAHVNEHMIFKGTAKREVGQIASEVEGSGGEINAYTSFDHTVYYITMASRFFDTGLDVLADAVRNASFDAAELDKELNVILEEVKRSNDSPSQKLGTQLFQTTYTTHPFHRPIIGYEETIKSFTREMILDFYGRFYIPENMIVVATGDLDEAEALAKIEGAFGDMAPTALCRPVRNVEPEQAELRSFFLYEPVAEGYLDLAFHIPGLLHEDAQALDLLGVVLGSGESSRLHRRVKSEKQLVHGSWAYSYSPSDPGLFIVGAALSPEKSGVAIEALLQEVQLLRAGDIAEDELEKARKNIEADFIFERETVQGQAKRLGYFQAVAQDLDYEEKYLAKIRQVGLGDLARVAQKYLQPQNVTIGLLVPQAAKKSIDEEAIRQTPAKILIDRPGVVIREDRPEAEKKKPSVKRRTAGLVADRQEDQGVVRIELTNKIRLLFKRNSAVPIFSLRTISLGGSRFESEATQGLSHFVSGMLTKGTQNHSDEELALAIERLGGSIKGYSGRNTLGVTADFLADDFSEALDLIADVVRNPSFDEQELEKQRDDILFQISRREDELTRLVFDLFSKKLYRKHPFRFPILGSAKSIKKLTAADLQKFYRDQTVPENLIFTIVGDLTEKQVVEAIDSRFGDLAAASFTPPDVPTEKPAGKIRKEVIKRDKEQAHLMLGFLGTTFTDPDRYSLEVLNSILAGQGGRLFVRLRDRMHLAYSITSFTAEGIDPGYFAVYIGTSPGNVEVAVEEILVMLDQVRDENVTEAELLRAKRYMIGLYEMDLQTNSSQASNAGFNEAYGLGYAGYKHYAQRVQAVTADQVREIARKYLLTDRYTLAIVQP